MRCVLGLADGRNEPIKDLDNATRVVLVDNDTVGAEDITFAIAIAGSRQRPLHIRNTSTRMQRKSSISLKVEGPAVSENRKRK